mmetsp:Transcript_7557/g.16823  ORF Transcript_7557/g.16823 Transcript_7557/m.16823 type:complete len:530 (+) Transcript_7557:136-1725(+)
MGRSSKRKGGSGSGSGSGGGSGQRRNITGYGSASSRSGNSSNSNSSSNNGYVSPASRKAKRDSDLGTTLIHLGIIWLIVGVLIQFGKGHVAGKVGEQQGAVVGGDANAAITAIGSSESDGTGSAAFAAAAAAAVEAAAASIAAATAASSTADAAAFSDNPSSAAAASSHAKGTTAGTGTGTGTGTGGNILKKAQDLAASAAGFVTHHAHPGAAASSWDGYSIPKQQLQSMTSYPNPLSITDGMRREFHPVVKFVEGKKKGPFGLLGRGKESDGSEDDDNMQPYKVMDFTKRSSSSGGSGSTTPAPGSLIPPDQWKDLMKQRKKSGITTPYTVGRYDEDRRSMYSSDLFSERQPVDETTGSGSGSGGKRTVHVGIDIGGPVGTKVYAFADGVVHSAGYNEAWGDYGHVVVIEHDLRRPQGECSKEEEQDLPAEKGTSTSTSTCSSKIWALYGHLNSVRGKKPGKRIKRGQVVGAMGDLKDNGGGYDPHVHFQLSTRPPETHDMPGVVSTADRPRALVEYPDPRLVLGPLY